MGLDQLGGVQETSEEVRLQIVAMIGGPAMDRCGSQLVQHVAAITCILQQALDDPFHEVKKVKICMSSDATPMERF